MYKKSLTYTDYNGVSQTTEHLFNLSKAELAKMELTTKGGMEQFIQRIIDEKDVAALGNMFEELILMSYGKKSPDGQRFIKVENGHRLADDFKETEAYSELYVELVTNAEAAATFVAGIVPQDMLPKPSAELVKETLAAAQAQ